MPQAFFHCTTAGALGYFRSTSRPDRYLWMMLDSRV